jgi:hypothetical protein
MRSVSGLRVVSRDHSEEERMSSAVRAIGPTVSKSHATGMTLRFETRPSPGGRQSRR